MSVQGATLLVMRPGRETLRISVISPHWPYQLLGVFLLPVLMGAAGRFGWRALDEGASGGAPSVAIASRTSDAATQPAPGRAASPPPQRPLLATTRAVASSLAPRLTGSLVSRQPPAPRQGVIDAQPVVRAFRVRADDGPADALGLGTFLRLGATHLGESVRVQPFEADGTPRPDALAAISHLMRCRVTGEEVAVDPRLVRLLAQLAAQYARPIQLISGHRAVHALGTSPTSQHTTGRAADIRIAGVAAEELRSRAVELGAGGVGLYPEKGFVHVDVRSRPYFQWIYTEALGEQPYDRSSPPADATLE